MLGIKRRGEFWGWRIGCSKLLVRFATVYNSLYICILGIPICILYEMKNKQTSDKFVFSSVFSCGLFPRLTVLRPPEYSKLLINNKLQECTIFKIHNLLYLNSNFILTLSLPNFKLILT